jgi:hypothetical protein
MTTGINGQMTCILRTDEKYEATWHHWAVRVNVIGPTDILHPSPTPHFGTSHVFVGLVERELPDT